MNVEQIKSLLEYIRKESAYLRYMGNDLYTVQIVLGESVFFHIRSYLNQYNYTYMYNREDLILKMFGCPISIDSLNKNVISVSIGVRTNLNDWLENYERSIEICQKLIEQE